MNRRLRFGWLMTEPLVRGARAVAEGALTFSKLVDFARPALVNGAAGIVGFDPHGRPFSSVGFTITDKKVGEI